MKYKATVDFTIRNVEFEADDNIDVNRLQDVILAAIPEEKKPKRFNSMAYQIDTKEYTEITQ